MDHKHMQDVVNYDADLAVIESHLIAARRKAEGLFLRNPISRSLECFDGLDDELTAIRMRVRQARIVASNRLIEITT